MADRLKPWLLTDPLFLEHDTGPGHPERAERLRTVQRNLEHRPVLAKFDQPRLVPCPPGEIDRVHAAEYREQVQQFAQRGGGRIEADTVVSPKSYDCALLAAGAAVQAVDGVLSGKTPVAMALVRPPGHHALQASAMGFCLFNNVAVAAQHAVAVHKLERVLIVDFDVHHGNGTQDLFYEDPHVWFFSSHRSPFYPGTGAAEETGVGAGLGTKFNLPVKFGTPRKEFLSSFERMLVDAAKRCRPQLVLLSAGFDAHRDDPIGSLGLETEDFGPLTDLVRGVAKEYCAGKLVSLLEGGYNVDALADCVELHLERLARQD